MSLSLQDKMFQEMRDKEIFDQAQQHAYDYLDNALERNVFPTDNALANL